MSPLLEGTVEVCLNVVVYVDAAEASRSDAQAESLDGLAQLLAEDVTANLESLRYVRHVTATVPETPRRTSWS